ncbi:proteasome component M29 [Coemansia sp. RSA 720]|nr:proteasome component M29 [Coemansia sp. RSA 720]
MLMLESAANFPDHYARTLRVWRERFLCGFDKVLSTAAPKNAQLILQEQELTGGKYQPLSYASSTSSLTEIGNAEEASPDVYKHRNTTPDAGYNDVFRRKWEYYFAYCEGAFATRTIGCTQLVFTRTYNEDLSDLRFLIVRVLAAQITHNELVENLQLRFALAQSEEQLQKLITGLLVPLLDKLDIASATVRTKIIALLGQINKKLKGNPGVKIPIDSLLEGTFGKEATGFSQGFRLMYISMAIESAEDQQLVTAIPHLLDGIQSRPSSQQTTLTTSLLMAIWRGPKLSETQVREFDFVSKVHRAVVLVALARDIFLYHASQSKSDSSQMPVSAGLSLERQALLTNNGKARWTSDSQVLQQLKERLVHIIGSGVAFPIEMPAHIHEQRLLALLCASCDPYFQQVADGGKDAIKRMCRVDYDSVSFVNRLFEMFLGGAYTGDSTGNRSPVSAAVRLKLLGYLNRSELATTSYQRWTRVITESLFGTGTTVKLRQQGVAFLLWTINRAPSDQVSQASALLLQLIQKTLFEGTTTSATTSLGEDVLRGSAYVAYGTLAKRVPALALDNLEHLRLLFDAFTSETASVRLSVQEGLLAMLPAYESNLITRGIRDQMSEFLRSQLDSSVYQARYCALRYVISAFPFADMNARWLCILGLADAKPEIQLLAKSGLAIRSTLMLERSGDLPSLQDAILFIYDKASKVIDGSQPLISENRSKLSIANFSVYSSTLGFCRSLLLATGVAAIKKKRGELVVDPTDLEFVNEHLALSTELQRNSMQEALSGLESQGESSKSLAASWLDIIGAVLHTGQIADSVLLSKVLMYLVEGLSLGSQALSLAFFENRRLLLSRLDTHNFEVQLYAAQAMSVIYCVKLLSDVRSDSTVDSAFWNEQVAAQLTELLASATAPVQPKLLDKQQGSIIALGYIAHGLQAALKALKRTWADMGMDKIERALTSIQVAAIDGLRVAGESNTHPAIATAWCSAAGEICQLGITADMHSVSSAQFMATSTTVVKSAGNPRVHETALTLLSDIALGSPDMALELIEFLQSTAGSMTKKQLDMHFKTGEALARALGRFQCTLVNMNWVFPLKPAEVFGDEAVGANAAGIDKLFTAVTTKMSRSTNMQERQAAAIWTLTIVQSCPGMDELVPWLSKLHSCLCMLLSDRSELTQEVASRALGLIYSLGDSSLKEEMVYSLISLFGGNNGGGRRPGVDGSAMDVQQTLRQQIQSNEPLLEQESLGQTPDGHAINTTYKSILSLASDMQNPSLVYQFMQLATHTAMWNSRCGAAYGVANIIEQARGAIQPYMKSMIPKLYRYTYDPSPQTQAAMKSIWNALLGPGASREAAAEAGGELPTSGANVVERYWDAIIEECLASMGQREWKVRESGCNALASAVSGADPELMVPYIDKIWQMSFRTLDDIKGSVREAGLKMCQSMATATVTWCTPSSSANAARDKQAQAIINGVIPFLVDKGVNSDAEDVRNFSMGLLLKLCKASGRYLSVFAPAIIERLLESLSNMESQTANYLTFHADGHGVSQEQLESARLSAVKSSPIMQGVETLLEYLTSESMEALVPKLQNIIRHGLGLPARAGCARTVVILCVKKAELVRPFASALVKAISGSLTESSALQRQAWAAAIGYMAPMLTANMFKNMLKHLEKVYFDKYEDEVRGATGLVLEQLAQRSPERLCENTSGPGTVSFVLFGCWDTSEVVGKAFQSAWQEYMLGLGSKLVTGDLLEVLRLPLAHIAADSWSCRIQSAKAIADVARMVEREARAIDASNQNHPIVASVHTLAQTALPELVKASRGRMWPGKEHVLGTLVKLCVVCSGAVSADHELQGIPAAVCDILLKEMKQGEIPYRREIVKHCGTLVEGVGLDVYSQLSGPLLQLVEQFGTTTTKSDALGANAMDIDDDDEGALKRPQQLMLVAAAVKTLQLALPKTQHLGSDEAGRLAGTLQNVAHTGVWNTRVASLECLTALLKHCAEAGPTKDLVFAVGMTSVLEAVTACAAEGKYVSVRTAALGTLEAVLGAVSSASADSRAAEWPDAARGVLELFLKDPVPSISDRAKELATGK